ncbi:restriction endonuclease [Rhizobium ruizarguesonis]|uniref:restriction endonuclease n=1 Tax=Rhizobium TaxID=379 RepID=UPI0013DEF998|nr:restriction endonuclease [Rhizobium ruizarguesonis]
MRSYRIGRAHLPIATGQGAAKFGGRWNPVGSAVIYTADSGATAMMELFAERSPDTSLPLRMATFEYPDTAIDQIDLANTALDDTAASLAIGQRWLDANASAVLKVPSRRVNGGYLYLINPAHPDFPAFEIVSDELLFEEMPTPILKADRSLGLIGLPGVQLDNWTGLVDLQGRPLTSGGKAKALIEVQALEGDLLARLRADPRELLRLSPREFERAMAAFYEDLGWQVQLTPERKDGGKDLIIAKADEAGTRMCYVECKRYALHKPVSVGIIRELWGVVDKDNATSGIVAATSYFTKGARAESQSARMAHRMALYDYDALVAMLRSTIGGARR